MTVTEGQGIEALRPVTDPELHVSIVELDMVRHVDIRRGRVAVTVALTVPGCPLRDEITRRVTDAVRPLKGVKEVAVELTVMTPAELDAVRARMQAAHQHGAGGHSAAAGVPEGQPGAAGPRPLGHEEGRPNPFGPESRTRVIGITSG